MPVGRGRGRKGGREGSLTYLGFGSQALHDAGVAVGVATDSVPDGVDVGREGGREGGKERAREGGREGGQPKNLLTSAFVRRLCMMPALL